MNVKALFYSILSALALAGGWAAQALGGWDSALQMLCIVMAADYLSGIACALIWKKSPKSADGTFESKASLKGLLRKAAMLLAVLIAYRLDRAAGTAFVRTATILFFTANDGFSVIENLGIMGLPLPAAFKNAFSLLRQQAQPTEESSV